MKRFILAACALIAFFAIAAADLALRSRAALRAADLHALWQANPLLKTRHYTSLYEKDLSTLTRSLSSGSITKETAERQAALIKSERDFHLAESSAKLSWLWYKTAAEKFNSPLNPWAALARKQLPAAKASWRAELSAQGLKTEDWMIE